MPLPEDHPAAWINDYPGQWCVCPFEGNPCPDHCYIGLSCDQIAESIVAFERDQGHSGRQFISEQSTHYRDCPTAIWVWANRG